MKHRVLSRLACTACAFAMVLSLLPPDALLAFAEQGSPDTQTASSAEITASGSDESSKYEPADSESGSASGSPTSGKKAAKAASSASGEANDAAGDSSKEAESDTTHEHTFKDLVCTVCGKSQLSYEESPDGGITITGYSGTLPKKLAIPAEIDGKKVTAIGKAAFRRATISSLVIPEGVTSLGAEAFYACLSLSKIKLPNSLAKVGDSCFYSNRALADMTLPKGVVDWGSGCFESCTALVTAKFAEGSVAVGEEMFSSCARLKNVTLADSVKKVGKGAFRGCAKIEKLDMPGSLEELGEEALSGCSGITSLTFSGKLATVGDRAFYRIANSEDTTSESDGVTLHGAAKLVFKGDAPDFSNSAFEGLVAQVTYSEEKSGWDKAKIKSPEGIRGYFGSYDITWQGISHFHTWDSGSVTKEPTCTEPGSITYHCTHDGCIETKTEEVPALGHDIVDGVCTRCGQSYLKYDKQNNDTTIRVTGVIAGYSGALDIPETIDGLPVTAIKAGAFRSTAITSVNLPASIQTVGVQAFANCASLSQVSFADGFSSFGNYMFQNCTALETLTVPSSVTQAGTGAFQGCTSLETVSFAPGSTAVGAQMFQGCTSLEQVTIAASVNDIGDSAFQSCTALKTVELEEGLAVLGKRMFKGCTAIESLALPTSLTEIGDEAFAGCTAISSLSIPEGATTLGASMFEGDTAITAVDIPSTMANVGSAAFKGCRLLSSVKIEAGASTIGDEMFADCPKIEQIEIPGSVKRVGASAFVCTKVLGDDNSSSTLETVTLGEGIQEIGDRAFYDCGETDQIDLPDSIETIGAYAFAGTMGSSMVSEAKIKLPSNLKSVGDYAFSGIWSLRSAKIPAGVQLGSYVYSGCYHLSSIDVEDGVTAVPAGSFYGDRYLTGFTLPDSVVSIGESAFRSTGITRLMLPKSVVTIGDRAFQECKSLVTDGMDLGGVVTIGDYAFSGCDAEGFSEFVMPDTLVKGGAYLFYNCLTLNKVTLSKNLSAIENGMFSGCVNLGSVSDIPASVKSYGGSPFNGCTSLSSIRFTGDMPTFGASGKAIPGKGEELDTSSLIYYYPQNNETYAPVRTGYANWVAYDHVHEWKLSKVLKEPDCVNAGRGVYTCTHEGCTETKTDIILALGHDFGDDGYCKRCGAYFLIWSVLPSGNASIDGVSSSYKGAVKIPQTIGKYKVTAIADHAFMSNANITSVDIPASVKQIGASAFRNCTSLASVTLEDGITEIPDQAFDGCTALSELRLPSTLKKLGIMSFANCTALESVSIPASLAECSSYEDTYYNKGTENEIRSHKNSGAFYNCTALKSVNLPEGLTCLGADMFRGCTALASVKLPDSLANVGYGAFMDCTGLSGIDFGAGTCRLGDYMFANCTSLAHVDLPAGITTVPEGFLSGCSALSDIQLAEGITNIGGHALANTGLVSLKLPSTVSSLGAYALSGCPSLASLALNEGLSSMGSYCLSGDSKLSSLTLPNSLTSIGGGCFTSMGGLRTVSIGTGLSSLPAYAFWGCRKLERVSFAANGALSDIGQNAFKNCKKLNNVDIPASVSTIEENAFTGCSGLTRLTLHDGLRTIGDWAFNECDIRELSFPGTVTSFGQAIIRGNKNLAKVTFGAGVKSISQGMFAGCTALEYVDLPDTLTSIATSTFSGCTKLKEIRIPQSVTSIGDFAFNSCASLRSVTVPDKVQSLGYETFAGCTRLESISLGKGLTELGSYTFSSDTALESITFPAHIAKVPAGVLSGCKIMKDVTFTGKTPKFDDSAFAGLKEVTVHYPEISSAWEDAAATAPSSYGGRKISWQGYGHEHQFVYTTVQKADCEHQGIVRWTCNICDYNELHYTPALGHDYDPKTGVCKRCGQSMFTYSVVNGEATITGLRGFSNGQENLFKTLPIPKTVKSKSGKRSYPVVGIANNAFGTYTETDEKTGEEVEKNWSFFTRVSLPSTIRSIGKNAFRGTSLTSISVPSGATEIGEGAFSDCESLMTASLPGTISVVPEKCFEGDKRLYRVDLAAGKVSEIGASAFKGCSALKRFTVPKGVEIIWDQTFQGSGLQTVSLPEGLIMIGSGAFRSCVSLSAVNIPDSVTTLASGTGGGVFQDSGLTSVRLSSKIEAIPDSCFSGTPLRSVSIPDSVRTIGASAFELCSALESVETGNGVVTTGSGAFSNCVKLRNVTLSSNLRAVAASAFSGDTSLASIVLPDNISTIGKGAFSGSVLAQVNMPANLTSIRDNAFSGTYITELTFPKTLASIGQQAFLGCKNLGAIKFTGDAPMLGAEAGRNSGFDANGNDLSTGSFAHVTATVYYPADNATYSRAVRYTDGTTGGKTVTNYNGDGYLRWIPTTDQFTPGGGGGTKTVDDEKGHSGGGGSPSSNPSDSGGSTNTDPSNPNSNDSGNNSGQSSNQGQQNGQQDGQQNGQQDANTKGAGDSPKQTESSSGQGTSGSLSSKSDAPSSADIASAIGGKAVDASDVNDLPSGKVTLKEIFKNMQDNPVAAAVANHMWAILLLVLGLVALGAFTKYLRYRRSLHGPRVEEQTPVPSKGN